MRVLLLGSQYFQETSREGLDQHPHIRVFYQTDIPEEALEVCQDTPPDVVVVDEDLSNALQHCSRLAKACPRAIVILAVQRQTPDLIRKAAAFGVADIVRKPLDGYELTKSVERIQIQFQSRIQALGAVDEEVTPQLTPGPARMFLQSVIVVHSPKGGAGKTTIALNLAAQYLLSGGKDMRVILVDLDPYGNVIGSVELEGRADITMWTELNREPSLAEIENELTCVHKPTGLRVIPSPKTMIDAEMRPLSDDKTDLLLRTLRRHYHVIVIDCGPRLQEAQIVAMDQATRVYEVALPEVPTLRVLKELRDYVEALQISTAKFSTILNRVPKKLVIPKAEIRDYLPWPQVAEIPEDPVVSEAVNLGKIIVKDYPDSPFAQAIRKLVGDSTGAAPRKRNLLSLFKK